VAASGARRTANAPSRGHGPRLSVPKTALLVMLGGLLALVGMNLLTDREGEVRRPAPHAYAVSDPQFARTMGVLLGPPLLEGNRIETLLNGDEIFPPMLAAIRGARRTITFESTSTGRGA